MSRFFQFLGRAGLMLCGVACVAVEVWGTFEFLHSKYHGWNYLVAGGIVLTALAAVLPLAAEYAHRNHMRSLKWAAWLAVPVALAFVFTVSIQRTGSATDADETARQQLARSIKTAEAEEAEALTQLVVDKATVDRNCGKWGPICQKAKDAQANTEQKLANARDVLKRQGVEIDDSMVRRLVAYLPFLTKEQVQLYQPLLLPMGLAVVGSLMIAIGARSKASQPMPSARSPTRPLTTAQFQASKPRLVMAAISPAGSVTKFMAERIVADEQGEVEIGDLYIAYRNWCAGVDKRPMTPAEFVEPFASVCEHVGIARASRGREVYCVGIGLVRRDAVA